MNKYSIRKIHEKLDSLHEKQDKFIEAHARHDEQIKIQKRLIYVIYGILGTIIIALVKGSKFIW